MCACERESVRVRAFAGTCERACVYLGVVIGQFQLLHIFSARIIHILLYELIFVIQFDVLFFNHSFKMLLKFAVRLYHSTYKENFLVRDPVIGIISNYQTNRII